MMLILSLKIYQRRVTQSDEGRLGLSCQGWPADVVGEAAEHVCVMGEAVEHVHIEGKGGGTFSLWPRP